MAIMVEERIDFDPLKHELKIEPSIDPLDFYLHVIYRGGFNNINFRFFLEKGKAIEDMVYVRSPDEKEWGKLASNNYEYNVKNGEKLRVGFRIQTGDQAIPEVIPGEHELAIRAKSISAHSSASGGHDLLLAIRWNNQILKFEAEDEAYIYEPGGQPKTFTMYFKREGVDSVYFICEKVGAYTSDLVVPEGVNLGREKRLDVGFTAPLNMPSGPLNNKVGVRIREYGKNGNSEIAWLKGKVAGQYNSREWIHEKLFDGAELVKEATCPSVSYCGTNQTLHVVYCTPNNKLVELFKENVGLSWSLSKHSLVGIENSYIYTWNNGGSQHLVTVASGKIDEWWRGSTSESWQKGSWVPPLSVKPQGSPRGYVWEGDRENGTQHIVFRDDAAKIWEAWFPRDKDHRDWGNQELLPEADRPDGDLFAYVWEEDPETTRYEQGSQHILYRSNEGRVIELWGRIPKSKDVYWEVAEISKNAPKTAASDPSGYAWEDGMFVLYRSPDNHVQQLTFHKSTSNWTWKHQDLSEEADAPLAAGSITGVFLDHSDKLNVIYVGTDKDLHELWEDGGKWKHAVIRLQNGTAPPALKGAASFSCSMNGRVKAYIIYRSEDGQLIVLSREHNR
jgi:hypothetical protein